MTDPTEEQTNTPVDSKKRRSVTIGRTDGIVFGVILVVIIVLSSVLYNMLVLRRDVSHAKAVANQANLELQKHDGTAVWKLGSDGFQKSISPIELNKAFSRGENLDLTKSTLDQQLAITSDKGRTVYFIYRYNDLKAPLYVRIGVHHQGNEWLIVNMSRSTDPSGVTPKS